MQPSTTVAYRPCTAITHYILWLSSALSAKCAVSIHCSARLSAVAQVLHLTEPFLAHAEDAAASVGWPVHGGLPRRHVHRRPQNPTDNMQRMKQVHAAGMFVNADRLPSLPGGARDCCVPC